jgi:hypothetical protein
MAQTKEISYLSQIHEGLEDTFIPALAKRIALLEQELTQIDLLRNVTCPGFSDQSELERIAPTLARELHEEGPFYRRADGRDPAGSRQDAGHRSREEAQD